MTTAQIKKLLHESIENIDDKELLLELKKIAESKYRISAEPKLHKLQEERIGMAKMQIKEGNSLSNDQANNKIDKWLSE
ncbi:MAG: hypothetical protein EOP53_16345 [Sphingobacteriales bacterium]|nr:MAG: hypothetical protein EOP53_16345 [Sphingobacteriales bacterium]